MADKVTEFKADEWADYVNELAGKIADEKQKANKRYFKTEPTEEAREKYATEYARRILKKYPFGGEIPVEDVFSALESTGNESLLRWLDGDKNFDPFKVQEKAKADKFLPILHGVAPDGSDWYSMGSTPLMMKAAELGYDPSTKEGYSEFLNDVAKYQQQHDRGELVAEMRDDWHYLLGSLVAPTATKAIEEAVATGGDLSPLEAATLSGVDAVANAGMFTAPSINFLKANPILQGVINAGIQGAEEGARQGLGYALADTDVDVAAPFIAASLGATRPGMVGFVQGKASQFQGGNARDFARGIMKATRAGDPTVTERQTLETALNQFNENLKNNLSYNNGALAVKKQLKLTLPELARVQRANRAKEYAQALDGLRYNTVGVDMRPRPNTPYNVDEYLALYDNFSPTVKGEIEDGVLKFANPDKLAAELEAIRKLNRTAKGPDFFTQAENDLAEDLEGVVSREVLEKLKTVFPAKFAETEGSNAWSRAGTVTGKILADVGGRVEPIIRANPFAGVNAIKPKDYKESTWYKKMDKGSRAILDAAIKAKREELAEDNLD